MAKKLKLLYVDDEATSLKNFKVTFGRDFDIITAPTAKKGLKIMEKENDIALVVTDQRMPDMSGNEFLSEIIPKYPDTVRIMLTAYTDEEAMMGAINRGQVYRYIVKPWKDEDLRSTLRRASEQYQLARNNRALTEEFKKKSLSLEKLNSELEERVKQYTRVQDEQETSEQRYRAVVETATDAIISTTSRNKIIFWNRGATEMFGYTAEEAIGRPFAIIFPKGQKRTFIRTIKTAIAPSRKKTAEDRIVELTGVKKGGIEFPIEISQTTWIDHEGVFSTAIIRDITRRHKAEDKLRKREAELEIHARNLQEVNTALNVLLVRREDDKKELEERILASVKRLVIPYLEKMKNTDLNSTQQAYVTILETNLAEIISPVSAKLSSKYLDLTPKEIQVANLIKEGKTNRDIAGVMMVSINTILFHRHNLRKKLGLLNQKTNLRSYLTSVPT